ncbi:hypothetical protein DENSPDRAFT_848988 [Dentipellis sp. KUC8613]|nr:hypothetical protein DENSPDRAFT_848988 [Dentipellis sp. KUC8613]
MCEQDCIAEAPHIGQSSCIGKRKDMGAQSREGTRGQRAGMDTNASAKQRWGLGQAMTARTTGCDQQGGYGVSYVPSNALQVPRPRQQPNIEEEAGGEEEREQDAGGSGVKEEEGREGTTHRADEVARSARRARTSAPVGNIRVERGLRSSRIYSMERISVKCKIIRGSI